MSTTNWGIAPCNEMVGYDHSGNFMVSDAEINQGIRSDARGARKVVSGEAGNKRAVRCRAENGFQIDEPAGTRDALIRLRFEDPGVNEGLNFKDGVVCWGNLPTYSMYEEVKIKSEVRDLGWSIPSDGVDTDEEWKRYENEPI